MFFPQQQPLIFGTGIEDTFIPQESIGQRKLDEYELTQHYLFWKEDLQMAAEAGARYIRWGIPWYQIEPEDGKFDFSWVDKVAGYTKELGLEVVVDLLHYGTPMWMHNSFLNSKYPEYFARYARTVAQRYHEIFTYYTPTNEPIVNAIHCGRDGFWPPYFKGQDGFISVLIPIVKGMCLATEAIREVLPKASIVQVDAGFRWEGDNFPGELDKQSLEEWRFLATDLMLGRVDEHHPIFGYLTSHGFTKETMGWFATHRQTIDIMGVNYYPAATTLAFDEQNREISVEGGIEGLKDLLTVYWHRYGLPLIVTETSRNESTASKIEWLNESVAALLELRDDGMPVIGYTWFPFLDLIDWSYREKLCVPDECWNRLGLVRLHRDAANTLRRVPTEAVAVYKKYATNES
jgi:beta-glucosidase/6-phospho-beta-glucosidase/beta-galactosidase